MDRIVDWGVKIFTEQVPLGKAETKFLGNLFREFLKADPRDLDFSQFEHPTARTTDPISSHEGVDRVATKRQREAVLSEVHIRPGRTARELAGETGLDYEMVHKRLPELRTEGKVSNHRQPLQRDRYGTLFPLRPSTRKCSVTGRQAMEWWPVT